MRRGVFVASLALPFMGLSSRAGAQNLTSLRVVGPPNDGFKTIYYAIRAGLFRKYGVAVEPVTIGSGTAAAAALIGGSADIAYTNVSAVLLAHGRGLPIQILAPAVWYTSTNSVTAMLVAQDSSISTARDLNGKTVGSVSLGDNTYASILAWTDQNGGDSRSVKIIEVPSSLAAQALEEGRVSAVVLNEPTVSQAIATGKARLFAHPQDAIAPRFEAAAFAVMGPEAEKNADAMKRFALAIHESALYTNAHLPETIALVAAYSGISADVVAHSVRMTDPEYLEVRYIQPVIDVLAKYGILQKPFPARDVISALALAARSRSTS
jgi:NitT/TauT family transport system substrate-binding protein